MNENRAATPDFGSHEFRQALAQFATGVTIITTLAENGGMLGITASSFNSVSLKPPLILWSLANCASSMSTFCRNSRYIVNILATDQLELCRRFSISKGNRFAGVSYTLSASGIPILDGVLAWFECHNRNRYDGGDHVIFVGEVERCGINRTSHLQMPLIFHGGGFHKPQSLG
ncbi:flavin reductase family protein [Candidatus Pandoraea novymonadis]|uniref:p-hydroxyphenylacetate 3-hydroxylase, reductase component n=1 Tax=Candidatus Pandoraea novymonadis TaxID=1808959 RepID=A0ABX5FDI4_9BURK|nr:flavin reductase family protein [Candidatus Pandoraea novymonadis]PSB91805.1 p-hydroxyphenylacetate 3-hydroxylase, reductase component [Candidatus Pandoraea novymonadis]